MRPLDEGAMARARARATGELGVWLAGVTGDDRPSVRVSVVVAESRWPPRDVATEPALSVVEVAQAVDEGRERAADAARDGATLLAGQASAESVVPSLCLTATLTGRDVSSLGQDSPTHATCERALARHPDAARGPLHALRRLGSGDIAVLCGVALGAGERGLAYLCADLASTVAAAVATAIEPGLRPRLLVPAPSAHPAHRALLESLALVPVLDAPPEGDATAAALARLRLACTDAS
jgi:nicotinate-nucleotide--dimethylbenzimidazole phosphoribosyltransferase